MKTALIILLLTIFPIWENWSQSKYNLQCEPYLILYSYDSLLTQVGIKEATGNNDGPVQKYQDIFGLRNQPYCQMMQYWCYWINAIDKSDIPIPKSAMAISSHNYAKRKGVKAIYKADRHDMLVFQNYGKSTGHVERIIGTGELGWVTTVGANTSNGKTGSQREGNGNYIRERNIYHPLTRILLVKGLVGIQPVTYTAEKQGCSYK